MNAPAKVAQGAGQTRPSFLGGVGRRRDYVLTFGTEFAILAGSLLVFRLAAMAWGAEGFGEYVLARRTISWLQLPLMVGMSVGVTRYGAMARQCKEGVEAAAYFVAGVLFVMGSAAVAILVLQVLAGPVAFLLAGDSKYGGLIRAVSVALAGVMFHGVAYAEFRGRMNMTAANLLQFVNLGLVPLGVFLVRGISVSHVIVLAGVFWCVIAGGTLVWLMLRLPQAVWRLSHLRRASRQLIAYGAPRVLGDLALGGLFGLPVTIAVHLRGVEFAGFVGLGMSLLSMIGSLYAPLGHIVLPAAAMLAVKGRFDSLRRDAFRAAAYAVGLTVPIVVALLILAPWILRIYLGVDFEAAVPVVRMIILGAAPYVIYVVLRNVLDAVHVRPHNTKNLIMSVALFATLAIMLSGDAAVPAAVAVSVGFLGGVTAYDTNRLLPGERGGT